MTDPVTKHLKDLDNKVLRVLKHEVHLHFGAEGHAVAILLGSLFTGYMPTSNGCLRSTEIIEETILEGGWQAYNVLRDCWGE